MRLKEFRKHYARTHEGAKASAPLDPMQQLRRSVLACLLWEDEFYEDGVAIAERIERLAAEVEPEALARLAIEARTRMHLRHAPLLLLTVLIKTGAGREKLVANTIAEVVRRADEVTELLALYWKDGKRPLSGQLKKGLSRALAKFDAYELAKYNRDGPVKLRDVLFLVHPRPMGEEQTANWARLANETLASPDTWEVALSAGADKRETFERLLREGRLGYLALLRNLRGMAAAGVDEQLIRAALSARKGAARVLPFRYVAAARAAPLFERELDQALLASIGAQAPLPGRTIVLVDVSGSMSSPLSRRSDLSRMDAAAALAAVLPSGDRASGDVRVFTFSNDVVEVPARRGLAGIDAVRSSQDHAGTYLGKAVAHVNRLPHERLIVITDEQSHDAVPEPAARKAYLINVASNRHGVGYGKWTHLDGFSEGVLRWIREAEAGL